MVDELDPLIHIPVRLRIMVALAQLGPGDEITFSRLQALLDLTAGNLITHLRKLEEAGYIATIKRGRSTGAQLTDAGRAAFTAYRAALRELLG